MATVLLFLHTKEIYEKRLSDRLYSILKKADIKTNLKSNKMTKMKPKKGGKKGC